MISRARHDEGDEASKRAGEGCSTPEKPQDNRKGGRRLVDNEVERGGRYEGKGRTLAGLGRRRLT